MEKFNSIILDEFPNIEDFENVEDYYDGYWNYVLNYPLIFLPQNRIIFWGFEVKISKNEYDLLKSLIRLNTDKNGIFTEEEIVKNVGYKRRNGRGNKREAIQRFVITSVSRIKKAIKNALFDACINQIRLNLFNPFEEGLINNKRIKQEDLDMTITRLNKSKNFKKTICSADLNLTKILTYMLNFTNPYDELYSSFVFNTAFDNLIILQNKKKQKQNSEHNLYKTNFIFYNEKIQRNYQSNLPRLRAKDKNFKYAKDTRTKYNVCDFVNHSQ